LEARLAVLTVSAVSGSAEDLDSRLKVVLARALSKVAQRGSPGETEAAEQPQ